MRNRYVAALRPRVLRVASLLLFAAGCLPPHAGREEVAAAIARHVENSETVARQYAAPPAARAPDASQPPDAPDAAGPASSLRDYILTALRNNPSIKAAEESARAKAERIPQVTALPDPRVSTKSLPEPVRTAEGDNFFILGISQRLPVPEKLDRAGRIALEETRMALQHLQQIRLRVIADVKRAYFRLYVLDMSVEITRDNQRLLRGQIDVARAQVAAGRRPQDDVLRAQVELSSLEAELIAMRQRRASAAARLNELLDRDPTTAVPAPEDFGVRDADLLLERLLADAADANPALRRLRHQIDRDEHALEQARLAYWPEFTIGLEWMYMEPRDAFRPPVNPMTGRRPKAPTISEDGTDNWAVTFGFSLPIWFDKIKGGIDEARHRLRATRHEYKATQNRVGFQIEDALERVRAQRQLAALFDGTIIPQARQTFQVSQASYAAGSSDFLYVIDNWRKWLAFTIQYHRALGELEVSIADLEEAVGLSLPETGAP